MRLTLVIQIRRFFRQLQHRLRLCQSLGLTKDIRVRYWNDVVAVLKVGDVNLSTRLVVHLFQVPVVQPGQDLQALGL